MLLALAGFVGLPLLVAAADAAASAGRVRAWYLSLTPPPGAPPAWAFGPSWTGLYVLVGIAAWLVWRARTARPVPPAEGNGLRPLRLWGWMLLLNAAWAPAFFGLHNIAAALLVLPPLLALIASTLVSFWRVRAAAGCLLLPYLAWTCYAAYLTAAFWWLNPPS